MPQQQNSSDCGLFVAAFAEFFCYTPPRQIHLLTLGARGKRSSQLLIDFEGVVAPPAWGQDLLDLAGSAEPPDRRPESQLASCLPQLPTRYQRTFLTEQWFSHENPGNLRPVLLASFVRTMTTRLRCVVEDTSPTHILGYPFGDVRRGVEALELESATVLKENDSSLTRCAIGITTARTRVALALFCWLHTELHLYRHGGLVQTLRPPRRGRARPSLRDG